MEDRPKLITALEQALIEAARPQTADTISAANRLLRRLEVSMANGSTLSMRGILEELGLPDPEDIPMDEAQEKEWDSDRFNMFETWLEDEFRVRPIVRRSQQDLERNFGFRANTLSKFQARVASRGDSFYSVEAGLVSVEGKPELTFRRIKDSDQVGAGAAEKAV